VLVDHGSVFDLPRRGAKKIAENGEGSTAAPAFSSSITKNPESTADTKDAEGGRDR